MNNPCFPGFLWFFYCSADEILYSLSPEIAFPLLRAFYVLKNIPASLMTWFINVNFDSIKLNNINYEKTTAPTAAAFHALV
jgi:hypothetical protein